MIGAGAAGIAALRQCTSGAYDDQVVCYEKTDQIGGTWVYREETGFDRYGLPIHTSTYKSLRYSVSRSDRLSFSRQFNDRTSRESVLMNLGKFNRFLFQQLRKWIIQKIPKNRV